MIGNPKKEPEKSHVTGNEVEIWCHDLYEIPARTTSIDVVRFDTPDGHCFALNTIYRCINHCCMLITSDKLRNSFQNYFRNIFILYFCFCFGTVTNRNKIYIISFCVPTFGTFTWTKNHWKWEKQHHRGIP
jgi:hypothetical protein